jgi:hypothetical protein
MRRLSTFLVLPLVLVVAASGCGSDKAPTGDGPVYAALGDSYTAGAGIEPIADQRCARSSVNYPSIVAKALEAAKFTDRSCGASTTENLDKAQRVQFVRLNGPQLHAVDKDTTLVTIGIGLNNAGISVGLLVGCLTPAGEGPSDSCRQYLSHPQSMIEGQLQIAAGQVEESLEDIAQKAPNAQIVLVGYPRLVPDAGSCPERLPVPEAQIVRMRDAMRFTNQAWREAAEKAGAIYVDMYSLSEGHDICSDDPWVSDYQGVAGKSFLLHPFASYHEAVAEQIIDKLGANGL